MLIYCLDAAGRHSNNQRYGGEGSTCDQWASEIPASEDAADAGLYAPACSV